MKAPISDILKVYWHEARRHKLAVFSILTSSTVAAIVWLLLPLLYKAFFDVIASGPPSGQQTQKLLSLLWQIFLLSLAGLVFYRIVDFTCAYLQTRMKGYLLERGFLTLLKHSHHFFSNTFAGSLVRKINRLGDAYLTFADRIVWSVVSIIVQITGMIIILSFQKPIFAVVMFAWVVFFVILNIFLARWKMKYDQIRAKKDSENSALLADALANHPTIQLFAREKAEYEQYQAFNKGYTAAAYKSWNIGATVEAIQFFLFTVIEILIMYIAVIYWGQGKMTVGTFVLLQSYIISLWGRLWDFGRMLRQIYESFTDAQEMVEIINLAPDIQDIPHAQILQVSHASIEFKHVCFSYQKTRAVVQNLSLKIAHGERIALVGSSGAGKSTIIKLLLRLYDLDSGNILIDGKDIQRVTQESLRENIGFVPQEPILFHRTLIENIRYGNLSASDNEVRKAARMAHCDEFISNLSEGYNTYVGERGVKLSGGERQRIAIARAILKNAPILILDEATSSLDSQSELLIQDAFDQVMKNKTTIAIAHRLSTIKKMDRIIVLADGGIAEEGSHDALIEKPGSLYGKLWKLQSGGFLSAE